MIDNIITFGYRNKLVAIVLVVLFSLVSIKGLTKIQIDTSYESLISAEDEGWPDYKATIDEFGSDNTTIIYARDKGLWSPKKLRLLEDLILKIEEFEAVEKVDSLFSSTNIRDEGGFLESMPLMDIAPEDPEEIPPIKADALYSPLINGNLLAEDGNATAINVTVLRKLNTPDFNKEFYTKIQDLLDPLKGDFAEVFQVGPPRLNVEIEKSMYSDMFFLTPINLTVLAISIFLFLRTFWAAGIPAVTSGLSILWTFGFMGYVGIPITLLTAIVPSLVIVIGSTEDTHMLSSYLHSIAEQKAPDRRKAIMYMVHHVGLPLFITSFTTTFGFFTNSMSSIPLIRDFAYASSFAMFVNLVVTILVVPILLSMAGPTQSKIKPADEVPTGFMGWLVEKLEITGDKYGKWVVAITAFLMVFLSYQAFHVRVSNDPLSYFKPSHQLVKDADTLASNISGMQIFYLSLEADIPDAFKTPRYLKVLERVQRDMASQQAYDSTISLADHVSLVSREMHEADPKYFKIPDTKNEIEEYLLLFQRSDLERYVSADYRKVNVVVRHRLSDSEVLNRYLGDLTEVLKRTLPPEVSFKMTGENLMINRAAESLFGGQVDSLIMIVAAIFIIMSLLFTSPLAGLISLVPNLIPVVFCFGVMGLFGIPLNPGTATVAAIAVGIAIDDTIHLMTRYGDICRTEPDQFKASILTMRAEAVPVISTSIALAFGFSTLLFSSFNIILQFGTLAAATMIFALYSDLLVSPILLRKVRLVGMWDIVAMKINTKVLIESPLFRDMSTYQIKKSILLSQMHEFQKDDLIITQGEKTQNMYVVLSGEVDVVREDAGKELKIQTLGVGEVFGEVAFAGKIERTASVRANGPSEIMSIDSENIQQSLRFYPRIGKKLFENISRILSLRLSQANKSLAKQI